MDENKVIVVCGESFCSSQPNERLHFSQILEDRYGYSVTNLAQGGMSTVGICFQIREAIKIKPEIIIYNMASPDRVELILRDGFDLRQGLANFVYAFPNNSSYGSKYVGSEKSPVFSTVWNGLSEHGRVPVTAEQQRAIQDYLVHLFDWNLKKETDTWMFGYWHEQIVRAGIQPLRVSRQDRYAKPMYEFADRNPDYNVTYHTDVATQELMASNIHKELKCT